MLIGLAKLMCLILILFKGVLSCVVSFRCGLSVSDLFPPDVGSCLLVDLLVRRGVHQVFGDIWLISVR
jgi:hypothetical protein